MAQVTFDLIVVGGGAAGFFTALNLVKDNPTAKILIVEKSSKVLSKVRVSGGGRCNVTHHCFNPFQLADHYPRGEKYLKEMFKRFQASDMVEWLRREGVELKAEDDGRMFPITDDARTIIDCFTQAAARHNIKIMLNSTIDRVERVNDLIGLISASNETFYCRNVLVATGGSPKLESYKWLEECGHTVVKPIPSLFTFNDAKKEFADLMGVAVNSADVRIQGSKFSKRGAVLITHWGLSGPAVIKLSAWAATYLFEKHYHFIVLVNWSSLSKEEEVRLQLNEAKTKRPRQKIITNPLFSIPSRLWERICLRSQIDPEKIWGEISNKSLNKLLENIYRCPFEIQGKTTFKEEFVTCGGIDLAEVNLTSMESRKFRGMYFAGEVLNIDGETGGFNFQSAWTTGYIAAKAIAKNTTAVANT